MRALIAVFVGVCTLASVGCVQIEGGAVELSWSIRDFEDDKVECGDADIESIRICWQAVSSGSPLECRLFHSFDCLASRGVSEFEIDEGETAFFVQPRCNVDGVELVPVGDYQVPAPIVRTVKKGKVVTLNQLLVLVTSPDGCNRSNDRGPAEVPCTCSEKPKP